MKHRKLIILFLTFACVMMTAIVTNTPERKTIRYFNSHRAALEDAVLHHMGAGLEDDNAHIRFNYWGGEHPIAEYTVVSRGLVPSSKYYGFFYSYDNVPVAFQNANQSLTPVSDQTWQWNGEGDNHGMVRRLDANWFYFEAAL